MTTTPSNAPALLARIRAALAALGYSPASSVIHSSHDNLYEAYLLVQLVDAALQHGYGVSVEFDSPPASHATAKELRVRRRPGYLATKKDTTGNPYTHVVFNGGPTRLGAYIGIRTKGLSGVLSELDLLVIDEDVARTHVKNHTHPNRKDVVVHVEAKHFLTGPVDLGTARAFVGMASDIHEKRNATQRVSLLVAPQISRPAQLFVDNTTLPTMAITDAFPTGKGEATLLDQLKSRLPYVGPAVHAGAFCSHVGARGTSRKGKSMTCSVARDGRLRWKHP